MPNTDNKFNPAYSTITNIFLVDVDRKEVLDVSKRNDQCQYERIELTENVTDILPSGALIVRDQTDIVSFIKLKKIVKIKLQYISGDHSYFDITSTAYINNAASKTEQVYVSIYFTNLFYKYFQNHSLNSELLALDPVNWKKPLVSTIHEMVDYLDNYILFKPIELINETAPDSVIDNTTNYIVYKTLNPKEYRIESPTDNPLQYLNYLASAACSTPELAKQRFNGGSYPSGASGSPRFLFWTDFDNKINFKYFCENIEDDKNSSDKKIDENYLRFGVFDGDAVVQKLSDEKNYRKIYHLRTDPNDQFISKNYHYIRKVPKVYDVPPGPRGLSYSADILSYQFQDEGQKYNIQIISSKGTEGSTPGSDEILCENHWGFYNELDPVNDGQQLTHLSQNFGNQRSFASLNFMGSTGYFQYVDNPEMWKNMFDMTPIHPHHPDESTLTASGIGGIYTNLQKILDIRYSTFLAGLTGTYENDRLELSRKIEKQNFIMYSLCCMAKEEQSFFAMLTQYELDNTVNTGQAYGPYRYNWVRLNFNSLYGSTGPLQSASGGASYYIHQIEKWEKDKIWKGNNTQDDTWAINLNERPLGLTYSSNYLAPGWVSPEASSNFKWRPIGVTSANYNISSGNINHLVKMNVVPYTDLLLNSNNLVGNTYLGKYLYYFTVENVVDGTC